MASSAVKLSLAGRKTGILQSSCLKKCGGGQPNISLHCKMSFSLCILFIYTYIYPYTYIQYIYNLWHHWIWLGAAPKSGYFTHSTRSYWRSQSTKRGLKREWGVKRKKSETMKKAQCWTTHRNREMRRWKSEHFEAAIRGGWTTKWIQLLVFAIVMLHYVIL